MTIVACKYCSHCHRHQPLEEFPRNRQSADGYGSWCKACHRAYTSNWQEGRAVAEKSWQKWGVIARQAAEDQ